MMHTAWLGLGLLLVLSLACVGSVEARPHGAIAYDGQTGSWGAAYNESSQNRADARALGECRKHAKGCEVVVQFWGDLCAAYATGSGAAAGWGTGGTHQAAERNAVSACTKQGKGCAARVWSCNGSRTTGNEAFTPTEKCHFWDAAEQRYVTRFCSSR